MKTNRRTFLEAAGVSVSLPLLESLGDVGRDPSKTHDCDQSGSRFHTQAFLSKKHGRDYTMSPYLEKITEHREQFTVFSGLSHPGVDGGHRADKTFLTAAPHPGRASFRNSISLDQVIANEVGNKTRFRSLSLRHQRC